jgi:predicted extracellular nuclease
MKLLSPHTLWIAIIAVHFITSCASAQKKGTSKSSGELEVGFYNVENLFDTINDPLTLDDDFTPTGKLQWNTTRYNQKLASLTKVIGAIAPESGPAILGLCEIENKSVLVDLCDVLKTKGRRYSIVHKDSPDERGIDVAFLYDEKLFTVKGSEWIPVLLDDPKDPNTRDILHVWGKADNELVHFYVNHWPSRGGGQAETEVHRIKAAEELRKSIDGLMAADASVKIICMGDFNDYPTDKSLNTVLRAVLDTDLPGDMINMMWELDSSGLGSYNYRGDWGTLDQFVVSPSLFTEKSLKADNESVSIIKEEWMLFTKDDKSQVPSKTYAGDKYTGGYSDHLPVVLRLTKN